MKTDYFDLTEKVAVITGGATGIGLGIAEGLAEAGATTGICARREQLCKEVADKLSKGTGVPALGLHCDVTIQSEIETMVANVLKHFGRIDILINSAGVGGSEKMILEMEEPDWDNVLDVNLKALFFLSREVVKTMVNRGNGGKIVNVSSMAGVLATRRMRAYCASKAGLIQLTKVMSLEWVRHNIQVNAILPGYFKTHMNKEFFTTKAGQQIIEDSIPMRRIGEKKDIKGLAILLASSASDFMTGSTILIDGGQTAS